MIRDLGCFVNITTTRPPGKAPPGSEQRFKIKYREQQPIALDDLPPKSWKVRTVARGDRFRPGEHFDKTELFWRSRQASTRILTRFGLSTFPHCTARW